jgi:glycyl-tRNA synthetase beta chain
MFSAGERPTGSRDPLGLRRQAQGAVKILADLPELTGIDRRGAFGPLLDRATAPFAGASEAAASLHAFLSERGADLLEQRRFEVRSVRAVMHRSVPRLSPLEARRTLQALSHMSGSDALLGVAGLLKRVKNITKGIVAPASLDELNGALVEPAEQALVGELGRQGPVIRAAAGASDYAAALGAIAACGPAVTAFFDAVLVMAEDERLRAARLGLVASLRDLILEIADISEMAEG